MFRKTYLEINVDHIIDNVKTIKKITQKKFIAVLKADAYGCGDIQIATALQHADIDMVAISSLDEALMLRNQGYLGELLILGAIHPEEVPILIEHHIATTVYSLSFVDELIKYQPANLHVHLKVETGMNRIGFQTEEDFLLAISKLQAANCILDGVFTHYACADQDVAFTKHQFDVFQSFVNRSCIPWKYIHCDNSDASLSFFEEFTNATRVGIALYGISSFHPLKHAISLYTEVVMCKKVAAHQTIGYGATYTTSKDEWIVTIPIGYADGFIRQNQGRKVYCHGQYGTIVGRICMDQTMVRFDHPIPVGSCIEIFGEHIPIEEMAQQLHTIPYEILCLISSRVTRSYTGTYAEIKEENTRLIRSQM